MDTFDKDNREDSATDRDLFTRSTIRVRIKKPDNFFTDLVKGIKSCISQIFKKDQKKPSEPIDNHKKAEPLFLKKDDVITNRYGEHFFYIVESIQGDIVQLRSLYDVAPTSYEVKFKKSKSSVYKKASVLTPDNYLIVSRGGEASSKFAELLKKKK